MFCRSVFLFLLLKDVVEAVDPQQLVSFGADLAHDLLLALLIHLAQCLALAVSFNNLLRGLGIQYKVSEQWIQYAPYKDKGYVCSRMIPIHHSDGPDTYKSLTVWTQAGRKFLYDHLKEHGVLPVIERTSLSIK